MVTMVKLQAILWRGHQVISDALLNMLGAASYDRTNKQVPVSSTGDHLTGVG